MKDLGNNSQPAQQTDSLLERAIRRELKRLDPSGSQAEASRSLAKDLAVFREASVSTYGSVLTQRNG